MESVEYKLSAKIELHYIRPPCSLEEKVRREELQTQVDALVFKNSNDPLKQQDLANILLGNSGILINPPTE